MSRRDNHWLKINAPDEPERPPVTASGSTVSAAAVMWLTAVCAVPPDLLQPGPASSGDAIRARHEQWKRRHMGWMR